MCFRSQPHKYACVRALSGNDLLVLFRAIGTVLKHQTTRGKNALSAEEQGTKRAIANSTGTTGTPRTGRGRVTRGTAGTAEIAGTAGTSGTVRMAGSTGTVTATTGGATAITIGVGRLATATGEASGPGLAPPPSTGTGGWTHVVAIATALSTGALTTTGVIMVLCVTAVAFATPGTRGGTHATLRPGNIATTANGWMECGTEARGTWARAWTTARETECLTTTWTTVGRRSCGMAPCTLPGTPPTTTLRRRPTCT